MSANRRPEPADGPGRSEQAESAEADESGADRSDLSDAAQDSQRAPLSAGTRRRLAEVFGDVLPTTTSDERDDRDRAADRSTDDDLLADRPPHHDREQ